MKRVLWMNGADDITTMWIYLMVNWESKFCIICILPHKFKKWNSFLFLQLKLVPLSSYPFMWVASLYLQLSKPETGPRPWHHLFLPQPMQSFSKQWWTLPLRHALCWWSLQWLRVNFGHHISVSKHLHLSPTSTPQSPSCSFCPVLHIPISSPRCNKSALYLKSKSVQCSLPSLTQFKALRCHQNKVQSP